MTRQHALSRPARGRAALTGLLCVLAALGCFATRAVAATLYDVEVIVFRYLAASDDGEQWPENTTVADDGIAPTPLQQGLENLPDSQFALNAVAGALQRSGAYRVLAHRLWRQSAYDRHSAVPYLLHTSPGSSGREVDGSITLIRERYLHMAVDLTLTSPDVLYRLDEARRMRSGELNYFDNPHFGVIVRVTPYGSEESAPEDAGATGGDDSATVPDEEADTAAEPASDSSPSSPPD
jgi:Peptidoglycan-binding protein, CsiV